MDTRPQGDEPPAGWTASDCAAYLQIPLERWLSTYRRHKITPLGLDEQGYLIWNPDDVRLFRTHEASARQEKQQAQRAAQTQRRAWERNEKRERKRAEELAARSEWTVQQCAAHHDISPNTWRALVRHGHAPAPCEPGSYPRRWDADAVRAVTLGPEYRQDEMP